MSEPLQILDKLITRSAACSGEFSWNELLVAIRSVVAVPLAWEGERTLLALLRFGGRIPLTASSEVPHSMSPENMLKSLAVQGLGKWTGLTHLLEMQRLQATTTSPGLASVVRAVIQRAMASTRRSNRSENVKESSPGAPAQFVPLDDVSDAPPRRESRPGEPRIIDRAVAQDRGMTFLRDRPVRPQPDHHAPQAA
jgi:hypothetical protein